uniref:Uncharacterized protein n=1 Tax=Cucumis melo TaxID=3656 RepID=A0A9I9EKZ8_CUCME
METGLGCRTLRDCPASGSLLLLLHSSIPHPPTIDPRLGDSTLSINSLSFCSKSALKAFSPIALHSIEDDFKLSNPEVSDPGTFLVSGVGAEDPISEILLLVVAEGPGSIIFAAASIMREDFCLELLYWPAQHLLRGRCSIINLIKQITREHDLAVMAESEKWDDGSESNPISLATTPGTLTPHPSSSVTDEEQL